MRTAAAATRRRCMTESFPKMFDEKWRATVFSPLVGDARLVIADHLLYGGGLYGQLVLVGLEPGEEVRFDRIAPARVDLACGIFAFAQPQVPEHVAEPRVLGQFHDLFGQLWRDEQHA